VLLVGTALASAAAFMTVAGLVAVYLTRRAQVLAAGDAWFPQGVSIPLTPGTMGLIIMVMVAVIAQWAAYAIGNDDRVAAYCAVGLLLLLSSAFILEMAYYFTQIGISVRDASGVGVLVFTIVGAHLAMVGVGMLFMIVVGFRTLGGEYSARDREGVSAAAMYWLVTVAAYFVIWYALFVTK
jgi:cytochrome c oxidase subunit 3